jgi:RimJ/RimL family protein N-acetyltransferase
MNISTKRLHLRQAVLQDAEDVYAYRSNPAVHKFLSSAPKDISDIEAFIANSAQQIDVPNTWFQVAIVHASTHKVIGDIGIHFIDSEPQVQVEIGYTLSSGHQGKGFATEALTAIIDYLFNTLNKHRITASIDPLNIPSIALVERLKFRKEAHFKKSLFFKGAWVDDLVYAILKEDFNVDV